MLCALLMKWARIDRSMTNSIIVFETCDAEAILEVINPESVIAVFRAPNGTPSLTRDTTTVTRPVDHGFGAATRTFRAAIAASCRCGGSDALTMFTHDGALVGSDRCSSGAMVGLAVGTVALVSAAAIVAVATAAFRAAWRFFLARFRADRVDGAAAVGGGCSGGCT